MAAKFEKQNVREWLNKNQDNVRTADNIISARLVDKKKQWEVMPTGKNAAVSDSIFTTIKKCFQDGDQTSESSSVLLYGEPGSGRTHVVEWCITQLKDTAKDVVVLRAMGGHYGSDVECVRHLVSQAAGQSAFSAGAAPKGNASFETGMDWVRQVLSASLKGYRVAIVVLDGFEHFCSKSRQTLLYNLFDIAQDCGIGLSIIAVAESPHVLSQLEKRIRSRFNMHQLQTHLPDSVQEMLKALMSKVRLPQNTELKAPFVKEFNEIVEVALGAKLEKERDDILAGRYMAQYIDRAVPVYRLIYDYSFDKESIPQPVQKKRRIANSRASANLETASLRLFYRGLTMCELIVCLAIFRLKDRSIAPNLHRILHEIQMLHDQNKTFVTPFFRDSYCQNFYNLVDRKIIRYDIGISGASTTDFSRCDLDSDLFEELALDLETSKPQNTWSPLLSLPVVVQHWGSRQRT